MKAFRRILCGLLAVLAALAVAGCKRKAADAHVDGTLEEIMQKVYDGAGIDELPALGNMEITKENAAYYFGTDAFEFTEGLASEALINAIPHSVCLARLPVGADAEQVKKAIRENANPNKWICVGVDASDVIVDSIGDLVILIMADDADKLDASFKALSK